jgi:membrane protease YdiL (CAAX protease family)
MTPGKSAASRGAQDNKFTLRRLVLSLSTLGILTSGFDFFSRAYFIRLERMDPASWRTGWIAHYADSSLAAFLVLEMLGVVWIYRPVRQIWRGPWVDGPVEGGVMKDVLWGFALGLGASVLFVPFHHYYRAQTVALVTTSWLSLRNPLVLLLFLVALSVSTEIFFRGIVFRTLEEQTGLFAAAVASSLIFAWFWPVLGFWMGAVLGAGAALLYYRRNSLLPGAIANGTATFCCAGWFLYMSLTAR